MQATSKIRTLIEHLASCARHEPLISSSLIRTAQDLVTYGRPIPEYLLPGRFIMRQTQEVRDLLKELKPEDTISGGDWMAATERNWTAVRERRGRYESGN